MYKFFIQGVLFSIVCVVGSIYGTIDMELEEKEELMYSRSNPSDVQTSFDHGVLESSVDFKTIYSYITSVFKKVTHEDAYAIAHNLVKYGQEYDLDPKLAAAVMARESSFNREAVSVTGAKGLGQIKDFNFDHLNIEDPYDIKQNASGTVKFLKQLISKWKDDSDDVSLGLASYFQGYTNVKNFKKDQGGLTKKTQGYVDDILSYYNKISALQESFLTSANVSEDI